LAEVHYVDVAGGNVFGARSKFVLSEDYCVEVEGSRAKAQYLDDSRAQNFPLLAFQSCCHSSAANRERMSSSGGCFNLMLLTLAHPKWQVSPVRVRDIFMSAQIDLSPQIATGMSPQKFHGMQIGNGCKQRGSNQRRHLKGHDVIPLPSSPRSP
jgi:hypothetical protein